MVQERAFVEVPLKAPAQEAKVVPVRFRPVLLLDEEVQPRFPLLLPTGGMDIKHIRRNTEYRFLTHEPFHFGAVNQVDDLTLSQPPVPPQVVAGDVIGVPVLPGHTQQDHSFRQEYHVGLVCRLLPVQSFVGLGQCHDLPGHDAVAVLSRNGQEPIP